MGIQRERDAMQETLNRIARYADYNGCNVQVMIDTVNESQRRDRVANMYAHTVSYTHLTLPTSDLV